MRNRSHFGIVSELNYPQFVARFGNCNNTWTHTDVTTHRWNEDDCTQPRIQPEWSVSTITFHDYMIPADCEGLHPLLPSPTRPTAFPFRHLFLSQEFESIRFENTLVGGTGEGHVSPPRSRARSCPPLTPRSAAPSWKDLLGLVGTRFQQVKAENSTLINTTIGLTVQVLDVHQKRQLAEAGSLDKDDTIASLETALQERESYCGRLDSENRMLSHDFKNAMENGKETL
ncbi:hypothetical protein K491DRAFT_683687 [Lophiostoma macrostomum CBS 122681]|uniref:Uncharacterized protein n=1 Tax=Lophiostoma macrostomum CBS 122681 TaxID=1314788 RepID=A0A6A6STT1_9PLEO|nr:hypothetical protein K491DRAFT_683687 [Lophiostoma macrostomum CBS 122681]